MAAEVPGLSEAEIRAQEAKMEGSKVAETGRLINEGAEFVPTARGPRLEVPKEQITEAHDQMQTELLQREQERSSQLEQDRKGAYEGLKEQESQIYDLRKENDNLKIQIRRIFLELGVHNKDFVDKYIENTLAMGKPVAGVNKETAERPGNILRNDQQLAEQNKTILQAALIEAGIKKFPEKD